MMLAAYILLSFALGIETLLVVRSCAMQVPIRLTRGLAVSFLLAVIQTFMLAAGILLGSRLQFRDADGAGLYDKVNGLVCLGLLVVLGLKLLPRRNKQTVRSFDISRWSTVTTLAFALGINVLIAGLAMGFGYPVQLAKACIPMGAVVFLCAYLGIMMGRQNLAIRERRWSLFSVLFVLGAALISALG